MQNTDMEVEDTIQYDDKNIFSEFNDAERLTLITSIKAQDPALATIPPENHALLWLSDIRKLRGLAAAVPGSAFYSARRLMLTTIPENDHLGVLVGTKPSLLDSRSRKRNRDSSPSAEPKYFSRDYAIVRKVLERDEKMCVLTKAPRKTSDVCHIVPHKLHSSTRNDIWRWLEAWWGTEKYEMWQSEILGEGGKINTEQIHNMFTLMTSLHREWQSSGCCFRPIHVEDNKESMTLAFHWCPTRDESLGRHDMVPIDAHPYPENRNGFATVPGSLTADRATGRLLRSGRIFTMTTSDPDKLPLPSFALLDMLWFLVRIRALRGAGNDPEIYHDEDEDSDFLSVSSRARSRSPCTDSIHLELQENVDRSRSRSRSISPKPALSPRLTVCSEDSDIVVVPL